MKKKMIVFVATLVLSLVFFTAALMAADSTSLTVYGPLTGTGSVCLMPPKAVTTVPAWTVASNTIPAGSVWTATSGARYLAVDSGIATNSPTNLVVGVTDARLWRPVSQLEQPRKGLAIYNTSTAHVYVAVGQTAVAGQGIYLAPNTGKFEVSGSAPQDAIYVISTSTGAVVTAQDW